MKLSKSTPEEEKVRSEAMQNGLKKAINVPYLLATKANSVWPAMTDLAKNGNINCMSDLQVRSSFQRIVCSLSAYERAYLTNYIWETGVDHREDPLEDTWR